MSEYLDVLAEYQMELRDALNFFKALDGKVFEGRQIKFSVQTEPSLAEPEADAWCQIWQLITEKKAR